MRLKIETSYNEYFITRNLEPTALAQVLELFNESFAVKSVGYGDTEKYVKKCAKITVIPSDKLPFEIKEDDE